MDDRDSQQGYTLLNQLAELGDVDYSERKRRVDALVEETEQRFQEEEERRVSNEEANKPNKQDEEVATAVPVTVKREEVQSLEDVPPPPPMPTGAKIDRQPFEQRNGPEGSAHQYFYNIMKDVRDSISLEFTRVANLQVKALYEVTRSLLVSIQSNMVISAAEAIRATLKRELFDNVQDKINEQANKIDAIMLANDTISEKLTQIAADLSELKETRERKEKSPVLKPRLVRGDPHEDPGELAKAYMKMFQSTVCPTFEPIADDYVRIQRLFDLALERSDTDAKRATSLFVSWLLAFRDACLDNEVKGGPTVVTFYEYVRQILTSTEKKKTI